MATLSPKLKKINFLPNIKEQRKNLQIFKIREVPSKHPDLIRRKLTSNFRNKFI